MLYSDLCFIPLKVKTLQPPLKLSEQFCGYGDRCAHIGTSILPQYKPCVLGPATVSGTRSSPARRQTRHHGRHLEIHFLIWNLNEVAKEKRQEEVGRISDGVGGVLLSNLQIF